MIICKIYLDNIYCFDDFSYDFIYPKKIVNSSIEKEYLEKAPNFKYRKVNILIGSNASGKTSFGKSLLDILILLKKKQLSYQMMVNDKDKDAHFIIEIVDDNYIFYYVEGIIKNEKDINIKLIKEEIKPTDSYKSIKGRIDEKIDKTNFISYLELDNDFAFSWHFEFPFTDNNLQTVDLSLLDFSEDEYLEILNRILKTLDPSIISVTKSKEIDRCIIINMKNRAIPIEHLRLIRDIQYLSSGTKYGLILADLVAGLKFERFNLNYVDEQFSYINSDIEISLLSKMVDLLKDCSQLFFTTHNLDVLEMKFPKHTFNFLENGKKIRMINASERIIKNNVSVRNSYENDRFENLPDCGLIYEL